MLKRAIRKIRSFRDPDLDEQIKQIVSGFDWFLGIQASDPDTSGWGTSDFYMWVNNATPAQKVLKYCDGDQIRTVNIT